MKALLWKELRENVKWAFIALLAFGAACAFGLYFSGESYGYSSDGITLARKTFLMATTFGAPAVGLLLGFLQTLPELKADRWAALLHRPVAFTTVFWAKAVSGVLLYLAAVGLPYAVCVWLVATPGNFSSPFVPGMILPGLADLVAGLLYYFAALAVALQRGRSIFLLPLPLLAALHVSFFTLETGLFRVALEAVVAMGAALVLAGWGVMFNRDRLAPRPWLGKAAFVIVAFYGVCGLGDLALLPVNALAPKPSSEYVTYSITKEGVPLKLSYVNSSLKEVTNVDGSPVQDPRYQRNRVSAELNYNNRVTSYVGDAHGWTPGPSQRGYRECSVYVYNYVTLQYPRTEFWYLLPQSRYFVSYRPSTKKEDAVLGPGGFQPAKTIPASMPEGMKHTELTATIVLARENALSYNFLDRREMKDIPLPAPGPIYGLEAAWAYQGNSSIYIVAVALLSGLAIYDETGALLANLPYHYDIDRWGQLTIGTNKTRDVFTIKYEPSAWLDAQAKKTMPSYVETVDRQGHALTSYTLPPLPPIKRGTALATTLKRRTTSPGMFFGESAYRQIGIAFGSERLRKAENGRWTTSWPATKETILWGGALSIVLAIATFVWTRRTNFAPSRSWTWTVFVFLLGLPGFIAFRLACDWPARVACPACGRRRPVQETQCPACSAAWISPKHDGFEIFDQPATPAA